MAFYITKETAVNNEALNLIAHLPTKSLGEIVDPEFLKKLEDKDFMRIAVLLAQKGYNEGGCPIGGVIIDNQTRQIVGKGHNTLVQESHPYNHGETSAIRDAGRLDFSKTTMFTTLTPCDVCATLCYMRGFNRVIIGNSPNPTNMEELMRSKGLQVDLLIDQLGVDIYKNISKKNLLKILKIGKGLLPFLSN
jgi:cytosine deaminase